MFRNGLEPWHVILVVVVFVLLFGYKKLPDAARGLGKSLRILKSETRALREENDGAGSGGAAGAGKDTGASGADTPQRPGALDQAPERKPEAPTAESAKDEQHTA